MLEQDAGPRILIVETDREYALLMEAKISRRFKNPLTEVTDSPSTALATAKQHPFDIAIIDFNRTNFDGTALVKSLCCIDKDLSIIVVADELTDIMVDELFRGGCDELLIKDSTFYNVIPHLVKSLYKQRQMRKRESKERSFSSSGHQSRLSPEMLNRLSDEIDFPVSTILAAAQEIMDNSAVKQKDLKKRLQSIELSAKRIKSFVRAYSPESEQNSSDQDSNQDKTTKKS